MRDARHGRPATALVTTLRIGGSTAVSEGPGPPPRLAPLARRESRFRPALRREASTSPLDSRTADRDQRVPTLPRRRRPPRSPGLPAVATATAEEDDDRQRVEAIQAKGEVPEDRLLDVGVAVFDAGLTKRTVNAWRRRASPRSCAGRNPASWPSISRRPWRARATGEPCGCCRAPAKASTSSSPDGSWRATASASRSSRRHRRHRTPMASPPVQGRGRRQRLLARSGRTVRALPGGLQPDRQRPPRRARRARADAGRRGPARGRPALRRPARPRSLRSLPQVRGLRPLRPAPPARGRRSHGPARGRDPRAGPDAGGHAQRALPELLRAHEQPLRQLAPAQLPGAGRLSTRSTAIPCSRKSWGGRRCWRAS